MTKYQKVISKETFNELMDNFEVVEKLTPKTRKDIKYHVRALQKENELLQSKIDKILDIVENDIANEGMITYQDFKDKIYNVVNSPR